MKISNKTTFHGLFLAVMSLLFNIANAQSSATSGAPVSIINGFIMPTFIKVVKGDTVTPWYEYAVDTSFAGGTFLPKRLFTRDTTIYDTFTVKKNGLPPTDSTGYDLIVRLWRTLTKAKDTGFVKPYQSVTVYPKPLIIKIYDLKIDPTASGGVLSFFGRSGSKYETVIMTYSYNYNGDTITRYPNPKTGKFTGNNSFSQNLTGILSSKKGIKLRIKMVSSVDTFDTIKIFDTPSSSSKPVNTESSGKTATHDSAFLKVDASSFNVNSKFYCVNQKNGDTSVLTVMSPKMETITFRKGGLQSNTNYTFLVYGVNSYGVGNKITITITTQPKLATPTFTAMTPDVRWDYSNRSYYILPKLDWITNSSEKIKRIDIRIYTDSLHNSVPSVYKIADANAGLTGPLTGSRIDSDSGRFWYEYVVETTTSIFTSNLLGYNVKWNLVPKNPAGVTELQKTVNNMPCPIQDGNIQLGVKEESELLILDGSGKPVVQKHIEPGNSDIDLSQLKGGNYYLMLSDKNSIATRKIQIR